MYLYEREKCLLEASPRMQSADVVEGFDFRPSICEILIYYIFSQFMPRVSLCNFLIHCFLTQFCLLKFCIPSFFAYLLFFFPTVAFTKILLSYLPLL